MSEKHVCASIVSLIEKDVAKLTKIKDSGSGVAVAAIAISALNVIVGICLGSVQQRKEEDDE